MAVEKMEMIDIVGHMDDVDDIARRIVLSSSVHMVSAITEVQQNNFPILKAQENVDAVLDYSFIRQYSSQKNLNEIESKINGLMEILELKKRVNPAHFKEGYDFSQDCENIHEIYKLVSQKRERINSLELEQKELEKLQEYLSYMKYMDVDLNELKNMKYINMKLGKVTRYNMDKLKKNYENFSALVYKLYQDSKDVLVMMFVPLSVEMEVKRVLVSLSFEEYKITTCFQGSPSDWIDMADARREEIKKEIEAIKKDMQSINKEYSKDVEKYYSRLHMEYKIEELKNYIVCTNEFFYLTGWVPTYKKEELLKSLSKYEESLIVITKDAEETREGLEPPTCLKNNYLTRPFEAVVKLYGIPSYNELDPTVFLGISYMLLFGAMFGDVGQGLVLFIIGEILSRKNHRPNLGGVFARLGLSSMFFGLMYGSLFGYEDIIPALLIRPMEGINETLVGAIVFGVVLTSIGYAFNLINCYKKKDVENGIFSKNGLVGMCFFWLLLYMIVANVVGNGTIIPGGILTLLLVVLLALMLLKEPMANLVKGVRPLYSESKGDYFIEGGFGIIETLLSIFSSTISFIRVGAFAINHVGLFIAFKALADMMSNATGSIMMIVLGNIIIIGLEGLIVFIQGLRLEYYELFSKYFEGAGYEYNPILLRTQAKKTRKKNISFNNKKLLTNAN
ncbi:MAG: ATPase [Clostridiales bacterium]|jgi:V/A-type H+-transporting ATPase subunit I|nr:ATPase [Clostridiales bacterium]